MPIVVVVRGVDKVAHDLSPEEWGRRAHRGFDMAGTAVEKAAKDIIAPHHYTGAFERGIHHQTSGYSMNDIEVRVGVSKAAVPHAGSISYGWPEGTLPSTSGLAAWLVRKGNNVSPNVYRTKAGFLRSRKKGGLGAAAGESAVVHAAIRLARYIRDHGFSFDKLEPLENAVKQEEEHIKRVIVESIAHNRTVF